MTRSELIAVLANRFNQFTLEDTQESVRVLLDNISAQLVKGGRVEVRGFGTFSVHIRPPRLGRNPMTGEKVAVPAKAAPHFKAGKELKDRVK